MYRYDVADFSPPRISLSVKAAKGVSIRALVRDLGRGLGCGACLEDCRCTGCGIHSVDGAVPFMKLMDIHPVDLASCVIPKNRILA